MPTSSFYTKLNEISNEAGVSPRDLLLVMYFESGVSASIQNPHKDSHGRSATGLIQFAPTTLTGMGLSQEDADNFKNRSAEDQLDFVKRYVQSHRSMIGGKRFTSATQYYIANFWPIALKKMDGPNPFKNSNMVIVSKNSKNPQERGAYNENQILDVNKDGVITVGDITNILMATAKKPGFQKMLDQFNVVAGNGDVSEVRVIKKHNGVMPQSNDVATNKPQEINKPQESNSLVDRFLAQISSMLDKLMASDNKLNINKYGTKYPTNKFLIKIKSDEDLSSKLEFAKVLSFALKEELDASAKIHIYANDVEVQCSVDVQRIRGFKVLSELCNVISNTFEDATYGIKIDTTIITNATSSYEPLDIKLAEINDRKFKLKFLKGKDGR
jgi:hypothetical protein